MNIRLVVSVCIITLASHRAFAETSPPPNIVWIMADDLGYGDVGCYGQQKIKTPRIDQLAGEGVRFTQCYAGSTVCAPSRCSLMTGKHMGHARIRGNADVPLQPEDATVAKTLKGKGYRTAIFGKWGLGEPNTPGTPNLQGFDEWFGYLNQGHAHNYYPDYLWENDKKIEIPENRNGQKGKYSIDLMTDHALAFIQRLGEAKNPRPFFLYLTYTLPHANNELGWDKGNGCEIPSDAPYSSEPWPQVERNFAAMVTKLDTEAGKVLDQLQKYGFDRNTILFFTSDNGPHHEGGHDHAYFQSGGPLRGFKRDLFEGGIRVPMIVRWPGQITAGKTSDFPWAFWDFLPTATEIAGAGSPEGVDGISVLPTLLGKPQQPHNPLYWEFHEGGFFQAVRLENWKGVRIGAGNPLELYDLSSDIGEQNDVAKEHPGIVEKLEKLLKDVRTEDARWPIKTELNPKKIRTTIERGK